MINLKGTKTEANLKTALAVELQVKCNYEKFSVKAREEGHGEVALYFSTTAVNEHEHASIWLKFLEESKPVEANTKEPTVRASKENIQAAIKGETYENTVMYREFAQIAKEEGFDFLAKLFQQVSDIEKSHADYFKILLDRLGSSIHPAVQPGKWKCEKCGNIVSAKNAPATCEVCGWKDSTAPVKAFKPLMM